MVDVPAKNKNSKIFAVGEVMLNGPMKTRHFGTTVLQQLDSTVCVTNTNAVVTMGSQKQIRNTQEPEPTRYLNKWRVQEPTNYLDKWSNFKSRMMTSALNGWREGIVTATASATVTNLMSSASGDEEKDGTGCVHVDVIRSMASKRVSSFSQRILERLQSLSGEQSSESMGGNGC